MILVLTFHACDAEPADNVGWTGSIDTLPSGHVIVRNDDTPIWPDSESWQIAEDWRIGRAHGEGPDVFGQIVSFEVDDAGRAWVLDGLRHQLLVFDESGRHLMTIGREGRGPGEFTRPEHVEQVPDGSMWVVDVGTNRISRFDSAGNYMDGRPIPSGYPITPWLGGMDGRGRFYTPISDRPVASEQVAFTYVRHDTALVPLDTLRRPHDPTTRETFEFKGRVGRVPLQGSLVWHFTEEGTVLALITDQYRLIEFTGRGDTLRTITRSFEPPRVTNRDREQLRKAWAPYLQDGEVPGWWSNLPETKPPTTGLFFRDDRGATWVERRPDAPEDQSRVFDVFEPMGRYLGSVEVPYVLANHPRPIVRDSFLYGVAKDELDVSYLVKLRVIK